MTSFTKAMPLRSNTAQTSLLKSLHWAGCGLFLVAFGLVWLDQLRPLRGLQDAGWPMAVLLLAAAITTLTSLARQLPGQNVLLAAGIIALLGGGTHAVGALAGVPFGPFTFTSAAGPALFDTLPWSAPFVWVVFIFNARGVARLILRPWRKLRAYGFWLIGLTAALALLLDLALEPFASCVKNYWIWAPTKLPLVWCRTPATNFLGFTVAALLMLAFATPALINKSHTKFPSDYHPAGMWLLLNLLFATGAAQQHLWPAVGLIGASVAVTGVFTVRGARW